MSRLVAMLLASILAAAPATALAQVNITKAQRIVAVVSGGASRRVVQVPFRLKSNDLVRTGTKAFAEIQFPDETLIQLGADTSFTLTSAGGDSTEVGLSVGSLRALVKKMANRAFTVRAQTVVCTVRGTEFEITVDANREVDVNVIEGVLNVRTLLGEEIDLGDGQPLRSLRFLPDRPIDRGLERAPPPRKARAPARAKTQTARAASSPAELEEFKKDAQREVALGLAKDEVQAVAAVEARRAEYQEGKTMIDVFGQRVRLEEYIVRPAADQFKFVVLNERKDRFDYFYYQAQFNQTLPTDLSTALRYLNGKSGAAPDYFITAFETGRSNTQDTIQENGADGHLVNAALAAARTVYDAGDNSFQTLAAGTLFWQTLFDNYSYKINGTEKFGWQPAGAPNITAYDYIATGFNTRILAAVCATQACETAARPSSITQPSGPTALHDRVTIGYTADGSQEVYDFFVVGDDGKLATAADFNGVTNGSTYKNTLLKFNYQQTITATEFGGRKIDLVVEPKILVKSGVIQ